MTKLVSVKTTMMLILVFAACHQQEQKNQEKADTPNSASKLPSVQKTENGKSDSPNPDKEKKPAVGDWPLFRGNAKSQGVARSSLPEKLDIVWKYEVKQGAFEGTPIIVGGKRPVAYIGDADGTLFAFDLKSGEVLWTFKSEIGYTTAPAYRNGKLYIGDLDGKFYCIDTSGKKIREFQADGSIDSSANFFKNLVLFGAQDARLYALDSETGEKVWQLETNDQIRCSITVVDGQAFVAGCDGALHIVDVKTGKEIDSVFIDSPTGVTPAVQGDLIFVGTEQSGFFAIDRKKSKVKWKFIGDDGSVSSRSSPAVNEDHVIFGSRDRTVYSINPITGKKNWAAELKANVDSSPVIVENRVFAASTDGRIYELEIGTGKVVWQKQLDGGIIGSPAVGFNHLVIATERGVVYCLGSKDSNNKTR